MIIYDGPSVYDGRPIVAIATVGSRNAKTGDMVQTWIMPRDVPPNQAVRTGADASVCGQCPHRPLIGTADPCYVQVARAPLSVWRAYQRGRYPHATPAALESALRGRIVRIGSWGDPAAVPAEVWAPIRELARGWTGYTHGSADLSGWLMMSVDSPEEASDAAELGLRYFRVGEPGELPAPAEVLCPASEEAGKRTTCATCRLCDGTRPGDRRRSVFIPGHSPKARAAKRRLAVI